MTYQLDSLPEFPAGFLKDGLYCIRCGKRSIILTKRDTRAFWASTNEWVKRTMLLCSECAVKFDTLVKVK